MVLYIMPYSIRKLPNQDLYRVYNSATKEVHSYSSTLENAKKQVNLLLGKEEQNGVNNFGYTFSKGIKGGAITDIDRTSTGVLRVKLNDPAKNFLKDKLIPLISNTTIRITDSRKNSGAGRSQVFGYGNIRGKGFGEFKNNTSYPELYRALLIFGMKIVPDYIPFTAIQVNHNYKTKKHIDINNIGLSLAVSFGDFTGGELVIGSNSYQTKEYPVIFNGALTEHFNQPIKGDRYSLVFFVNAPKKYSDAEVYGLHSKTLSKIKLSEAAVVMKGEGLTTAALLIGGSIETDDFETKGIVSLPEFRSVKLDLPTYMYKRLPDINGRPPPYRFKLVIPITSSRNLSSRKQETSLNINQKAVARPIVDIAENDDPPNLEDFSPDDKAKIQEYYVKVKANERMNPDEIDRDDYEIKQRGRPLPCEKCEKRSARPVLITTAASPKVPIPQDLRRAVVSKARPRGRPKKQLQYVSEAAVVNALSQYGENESDTATSVSAPATSVSAPEDPKIKNLEKELDVLIKKNTYLQDEYIIRNPKKYKNINKNDIFWRIRLPDFYTVEESKRFDELRDEIKDLRLQEFRRQEYEESIKDLRRKKEGKGLAKQPLLVKQLLENKIYPNSNMANIWITYVKEYAAKNGMSYRDALRDPACKAGYKKGGGLAKLNQDLISIAYDDSELGANAGKKYISL